MLTSTRPTLSLNRNQVNETAHVKEAKEIAGEIGELNNPRVVNYALRLIEERDQFTRKNKSRVIPVGSVTSVASEIKSRKFGESANETDY